MTPPMDADGQRAAELFDKVATDVGILLSTQIDLAKLELREEALRVGRAARLVSVGIAASVLTLVMVLFAAAWAIGDALDAPALGFLIVGVGLAPPAVVLVLWGRARLRSAHGLPDALARVGHGAEWVEQRAK